MTKRPSLVRIYKRSIGIGKREYSAAIIGLEVLRSYLYFAHMLTIHLSNLQFYAYHGLYEEETAIGGKYEVNVTVSQREVTIPVQHITDTIDYTAVYDLVRKHMEQPRQLLETVATTLAQEILNTFPLATEVSVSIKKITPPIAGFQGSVGVHYTTGR